MSKSRLSPPAQVTLTVDDLAEELNVPRLVVRRLIARGVISGTELKPGDWRFLPEELGRYVADGAPMLTMPPVTETWFSENLVHDALKFKGLVREAAQDQLVTDQALLEALETRSWAKQFESTLKPSPAINEVFQRPYPTSIVRIAGGDNSPRFERLADAYFTDALRRHLLGILRRGSTPRNPLTELYSTPERYRTLIQGAIREVQEQTISFEEVRNLPNATRYGNIRVRYSLGVAPYANRLPRLAEQAF